MRFNSFFIIFNFLILAVPTIQAAEMNLPEDKDCALYSLTVVPEGMNCPKLASPEPRKILLINEIKDPQKQALVKRVQAYWDALIEARFETAYSFLAPAYKKIISYKKFHKTYSQGQGFWKNIAFYELACQATLCDVTLRLNIEFTYPRLSTPIKNSSELEEQWIFNEEDKQWYIVLELK